MIKVTFRKDADDSIRKVIVEGHANYGDDGEDIVCSGISILTISILNGLEEIVGIEGILREVKAGYTSFWLPRVVDFVKNVQMTALMDTFELGVRATESTYGDYITVKDEIGGELDD
ncbi:MAG: ribosomal-processing cysteine protease Prp [Eubacterium aggregans]